jgi:hypothetical protein
MRSIVRRLGTFGWLSIIVGMFPACSTEPVQPPTRFEEDFSGQPIPFFVQVQSEDGQIQVWVQPGRCRRIALTAGLPPRVMNEYPCQYPTVNVPVSLALQELGTWTTTTNIAGEALFLVPDDTALRLSPDETGILFVAGKATVPVSVAPLVAAAVSRVPRLMEPPPPAPPPPYAEHPPPMARNSARRQWTSDELLALSMGICVLLEVAVDKCQEQYGALVCSVAEQWLKENDVRAKKVLDDVARAKAADSNDFLKGLLAAQEFFECIGEVGPKLKQAAADGTLPAPSN